MSRYELHGEKNWPYNILGTWWCLLPVLELALEENYKYISKDGKLFWSNPYKKGTKV
jgi:hypothetical protein